MKKLVYALAIGFTFMAGITTAKAGPVAPCTIDTSGGCIIGPLNYGKLCHGILSNGVAGTFYGPVTNSFEIPNSFTLTVLSLTVTGTVDSVIASVSGLPQGLSATFSSPNGVYMPNSPDYGGCFSISGLPCDIQDTFNVNFNLVTTVSVYGKTITLPPLSTPMTLYLSSPYPALTISSPYDHLCPGGAGNQVTVNATPGFGTYSWSNSATTDSITIDSAGQYNVTVTTTDSVCTFSDSIQIGLVQAQATSNTTICKGVFLPLNASGGDTYSWTPTANLNNANIANPLVLRTLDSTTQFTVKVSNGFCTDSASVTVTVNDSCAHACSSCTPNSSGCTGALPVLCSTIPAVQGGIEYSQSVTFFLPDTIAVASVISLPITIPGLPSKIPLDSVQISVDTLPTGFSWSTDQSGNNNYYYPTLDPSEQVGCISICGKTCDAAGSNYMKVKATITLPPQLKAIIEGLLAQGLHYAGLDTIVTISVSGTPMTLYYADSLVINPYGNITIVSGDTATLEPSLTYVSYIWNDGSKDSAIAVDTGGVYCVTVTDAAGCSQTACKAVSITSGIPDMANLDASLNIYPNPNNGVFNLTFGMAKSENILAQVFDVAGKVVYQYNFMSAMGTNNMTIDLGNAARGVYLVKLTAEDGVANRKITLE